MAGLNLSWRVGLIALVGCIAGLVALFMAAYVANGPARTTALPAPERLAALVALLEPAQGPERTRILTAVQSPFFSAWITEDLVDPGEAAFSPAVLDTYRAAMPAREISVMPRQTEWRFGQAAASMLNAVEVRIGLSARETLVVATASPFLVSSIGLPVGFGAGLIGTLIGLITLIMLHREFRPLSQLAAAVDRADPAGEMLTLPPIRARSPELRALVSAFARLQTRLATLIRARMALVGGIQHDLRTFATRLRLRIDKIADPAERERAATDISHMIALLDDAMLASRAGASELDQELLEVAPLIRSEVADRREAGASVDLEIGTGADEATVLADRLALRRIVANLVDNALKYGNVAHLSLMAAPPEIILTVDDEGPGIPPDRRQVLLEPFTRLDASRSRETGGAGLGLAVVRSLAEAHDGAVEIGDASTGGARLTVRLPLFSP